MNVSFKRKLYTRGSSYETTIPIQMLFSIDISQKHDVIFEFDKKNNKWYIHFEQALTKDSTVKKSRGKR
jgi:hypothetical protein